MYIIRGLTKLELYRQKFNELRTECRKQEKTWRDYFSLALKTTTIFLDVKGAMLETDDPKRADLAKKAAVLDVAHSISKGQSISQTISTAAVRTVDVCATLSETKTLCKQEPTEDCKSEKLDVKCKHASKLAEISTIADAVCVLTQFTLPS